MKVVKPGPDRDVPRGVVGGSEISQASTGAANIYTREYFQLVHDRLGTPHDIAGVVSFLVSPAGRWVNGQVVYANGGFV